MYSISVWCGKPTVVKLWYYYNYCRDQRDTAAIILKYTTTVIRNTFFPDGRNDIFTKVTRFCHRSYERFLKFVIFILLVLSSFVFEMWIMIVNGYKICWSMSLHVYNVNGLKLKRRLIFSTRKIHIPSKSASCSQLNM